MIIIQHPERTVPAKRFFNPKTNEFILFPEVKLKPMKLKLEHSLISMRNWEAEFMKPFCELKNMTPEELTGYIRCMTLNPPEDPEIYDQLTAEDLEKVITYITRANSAWTIRPKKPPKRGKKQQGPQTVESIYFTMIKLEIPIEPCEKWHLGSLMALIDYCTANGAAAPAEKPKNMRELRESWYKINEANKKKYHSRG